MFPISTGRARGRGTRRSHLSSRISRVSSSSVKRDAYRGGGHVTDGKIVEDPFYFATARPFWKCTIFIFLVERDWWPVWTFFNRLVPPRLFTLHAFYSPPLVLQLFSLTLFQIILHHSNISWSSSLCTSGFSPPNLQIVFLHVTQFQLLSIFIALLLQFYNYFTLHSSKLHQQL